MKKFKTSNQKCKQFVENKLEFNANNLYSHFYRNWYIVYSYGGHFPIYAFNKETGIWYENSSKYSASTSKHQNQARPNVEGIVLLNVDEFRKLLFNWSN